jgi:D-alanyl-lipoteichoic acid acyltransferase DltB (MBOAT superfamily)
MLDWTQLIGQAFIYNPQKPLIFTTALFWIFFGFVLLTYQFIYKSQKLKIAFLTLFSLFFYYKSSGFYLLLLIFSTLVDYSIGERIYHSRNQAFRTFLLVISLVVNLGLLAYYKYAYLITDFINYLFQTDFKAIDYLALTINQLTAANLDYTSIFLPVGISFFTFQTISYSVDIYRGKLEPVKSILDFAFYVSFFPQLVAGPIVRASEFVPQIYEPYRLSTEQYGHALFLILNGLVKKMLISDYISINFVDRVFESPTSYTGLENLLAVYGYALQIYCDFSGYTDIAIGVALLLGFQLPLNFDSPYKAQSITDFWRRWHISLSSWLRDYLYIPLGGNRTASFFTYMSVPLSLSILMLAERMPWKSFVWFFVCFLLWLAWYKTSIRWFGYIGTHVVLLLGIYAFYLKAWGSGLLAIAIVVGWCIVLLQPQKSRAIANYLNLMLTMVLGGIWHGAHLRFLLWGFLHGLALAVHKLWMEIRQGDSKERPARGAYRFFAQLITFHFVCFCWIYFRVNDIPVNETLTLSAMDIAGQMLHQIAFNFQAHLLPEVFQSYRPVMLLMLAGYFIHWLPGDWKRNMESRFIALPDAVKAVIFVLAALGIYQASSAEVQPFIYFQF